MADEKKKRTIQEIRESKRSGEKMVYTSVPDYTSAKWAETAGVVVVGDSLAMIAHGHASTIPATMHMMVLHAQAVRRAEHLLARCRRRWRSGIPVPAVPSALASQESP
jgi:3-methyl-2-oxobutanoate hydroxymethyltransferase